MFLPCRRRVRKTMAPGPGDSRNEGTVGREISDSEKRDRAAARTILERVADRSECREQAEGAARSGRHGRTQQPTTRKKHHALGQAATPRRVAHVDGCPWCQRDQERESPGALAVSLGFGEFSSHGSAVLRTSRDSSCRQVTACIHCRKVGRMLRGSLGLRRGGGTVG